MPDSPPVAHALKNLLPKPLSVTPAEGRFGLTANAAIFIDPDGPELRAVGAYLAERLAPATGYRLPVEAAAGSPLPGSLVLTTRGEDPALGEEGYELAVFPGGVRLSARRPEGVFRGAQTLRQLLPPSIESATRQPGPWEAPAATIRDAPRFAWRGAMLDVARHFFPVEDVKRYIDLIAAYKMNRLHLHLSDDQGWRLMIHSWPRLATFGGSSAVNADPGGYYTQADYAEIVAYAGSRYITVVPEIDMPGHTHAALSSYAQLNCDGVAPEPYTGIEVGFSSLCVDKEVTYRWIDDVMREVAALTPGEYIHIGGDEAAATDPAAYARFIQRVQAILGAHGKRLLGWEEIAKAELLPGALVQVWKEGQVQTAVLKGARVILSPGSKAYLDMKYDPETALGLQWAGYVEVQDAYDWEPAGLAPGIPESSLLGVEACLWSETLRTLGEIEFMAFPRLPGLAEIGWSPAAGRSWEEYRLRLAAQAPRLAAMGVNFYRSPQVPWE